MKWKATGPRFLEQRKTPSLCRLIGIKEIAMRGVVWLIGIAIGLVGFVLGRCFQIEMA
jgi:hypothetical protein